MQKPTLVLYPRWVVCVDASNRVLPDHAVVIEGTTIRAILPAADAKASHQNATTVDLPEQALIPGLINAHTHMAMNLMRGFADDLPLMTWLSEHIWPAEGQHVNREFVADGTRLAMAESLRGGVTCFNDMYFFPDVVAEVAQAAGMRASVGLIALDFPTVWAQNANEYIDKGMALHRNVKDEPLISTLFAPHAPYTVSSEPLKKIAALRDQHGIGIHMHVHETCDEVEQFVAQHGTRPLARLAELNLLDEQFIAVHMTQLLDREIELIASSGSHVLHCPESNLKLASGISPVARMLAAGINIGLGTDGAASNNDLDMLGEMRTAALIGKCEAGDAAAMDATSMLRMATINGASALGLSALTGSIEEGKQADLTAIDFNCPELQPVYNPVSHIVYSANRYDVSNVWVAGRQLLRDGELTTLDSSELVDNARNWGDKLATGKTL